MVNQKICLEPSFKQARVHSYSVLESDIFQVSSLKRLVTSNYDQNRTEVDVLKDETFSTLV
jgi:hypothetical protein